VNTKTIRELKIMKRRILCVAILMALFAQKLTAQSAIDPDADRILHAGCKYLADAKAFSVKVEVWKDVVLPSGEKLQTTRNIELQERRPDQLRIEVHSPRASQAFWYQNKTLTMLDRAMNLYGVMEVPGTIDKAFDAVEDQFGVELPLGDVLVADPYHNLMDNMETAEDLGKVTVLGTECHHLALTGTNVDCQLWIADGPKPMLRKCVINLKNQPDTPQITQIFSDWDLVNPISDSVFAFIPPDGALKITVNPKKAEEPGEDEATPPAAEDKPSKRAEKN